MTNQKLELAKLLEEKERRLRYNKYESYFPDTGKYPRKNYIKHVDFMCATNRYNQLAFVGANRTGKTVTGAFIVTTLVTGEYPHWWTGRRFEKPIEVWVAGQTNETTKNILQQELLGSPMDIGSGLLPKSTILKVVKKPGVADAIETVYIQHVSGGISRIDFKSYDQGRETFQGTKKQLIWLDEEPKDASIYTECLTRTAGDSGDEGLIICTFTPLFGLSEVVLSFLPDGKFPINNVDPLSPDKYISNVTWDDVPHLSSSWKQEASKAYSPHERDARTKGIPSLGAGAIYPYSEAEIVVAPFEIPIYWPRAYGMDVGWNRTAVIWGAIDPDSKQVYLYSEHYQGEGLPTLHASAIKARGPWIWGAIDPKSNDKSQVDGARLLDLYEQEGLTLIPAENSVEAGIYKVGQMFASGQLKIFSTMRNLLSEYRIYRRDEKGKVVKRNDHAIDAMRYFIVTGLDYMTTAPDPDQEREYNYSGSGRNKITGY